MKTHLLSYGARGNRHDYSQYFPTLKKQAVQTGWFDSIITMNRKDLPRGYLSKFHQILNERGAGYWTWKPWIITDKINSLPDDDILIYCDAQSTINKKATSRFYEYVDMLISSDLGCISFQFTAREETPDKLWKEKQFTYEQTFDYFKIPHDSEHRNTGQIVGNCIILRVNEHAKFICNEWRNTLVQRLDLFTDQHVEENKTRNTYFCDNRHDQSIFSVIRKKHGSIILSDETLFPHGLGDDSFYTDGTNINYPFWKYAPPKGWKFE